MGQLCSKPLPAGPTYLARQDVSEGRERVVQGFVINGVIQVLDEDISNPRLPEPGVPLRPHDADGTAFDHFEVHGVQGSLSWQGREDRGREECNRDRSPSHPTAAEMSTGINDTVGQELVNLNETGSAASQGSRARQGLLLSPPLPPQHSFLFNYFPSPLQSTSNSHGIIHFTASSSLAGAQLIYPVRILVSRATNPTPSHHRCLAPA